MQLLLYTESIIVHVENLMESEKKRHNRINMLIHQDNEIQKKSDSQKTTAFLYSGNKK